MKQDICPMFTRFEPTCSAVNIPNVLMTVNMIHKCDYL